MDTWIFQIAKQTDGEEYMIWTRNGAEKEVIKFEQKHLTVMLQQESNADILEWCAKISNHYQ